MKEIALRPDVLFSTFAEAEVVDFPDRRDHPRVRCRIRIDFPDSQIRDMEEKGMDKAAILDSYRAQVRQILHELIGEDVTVVGGMDEFLSPVAKKLA